MPKYNKKKDEEDIESIIKGIVAASALYHSGLIEGIYDYAEIQQEDH